MLIRGMMTNYDSKAASNYANIVVQLMSASYVELPPEPLESWRGPMCLQSADGGWEYVEDGMVLGDILVSSVTTGIVGITVLEATYKFLHGDYDHLTIDHARLLTVLSPDVVKSVKVSGAAAPPAPSEDNSSFFAKRLRASKGPRAQRSAREAGPDQWEERREDTGRGNALPFPLAGTRYNPKEGGPRGGAPP